MTAIAAPDFEFVSALVRQEAAIVLDKGKEYLVETRLSPIAKKNGFAGLAELVAALRQPAAKALRADVVEALTTNETSFFRDVEPFEMLRRTILPEVIADKRATKRLSIWCAASSTGQEPYTLAMLLRENFPELTGWDVRIVATDISREVLERARSGVFSQLEVNRGLPAKYLVKYFEKTEEGYKMKEDVRRLVRFEEMNLIKPFTLISDIDIVFMRNVLIYFDVTVKKEILAKTRKIMKSKGYLFLGAAETTMNLDDKFERRSLGKTSCYRKLE